MTFQTQLQGVQLAQVEERIRQTRDFTDEEALELILEDEEAFRSYLYYSSAKCIKRLQEPKNAEQAFLENLNHALDNVLNTDHKCTVQKEVSISHVFQDNCNYNDLFYTGRFDFVVYERQPRTKIDLPILAIELDGREHQEKSVVMERDRKKNQICREHGFELIRIENTYARRYQYMKNILMKYFASVK